MKNLKEVLETRQRLWNEMETLTTTAANEKREFTEEENTKYDRMLSDYDKLDKEKERLERTAKIEAEMVGKEPQKEPETKELKYDDVFNKFVRSGGITELSNEERSLMMKNRSEIEGRALSVTTTAGGYLIPQGFANKMEEALAYYCPFMDFATVFNTATGNDLPMPTNDDTSNKGAILAINTQGATNADPVFGQVIFKAFKIYPKIVLVPVELLQDSYFDLPSWLANKFGERIGRFLTETFTTGNNSEAPQGIVTGAYNSSVAPSATAITRNNIVDLKFSVDPAYRKNGKFMFNDSTLKYIMKIVDEDSRPLYQPSAIVGQADTIEGHPFVINNEMASIGASAKSMLFGDLSKYMVRVVKPFTMVTFAEKYMDYFQQGYTAFGRWDGRIVDAGTHPIKYMVHNAT
jgi:HK97 family phage major capsid protein